MHDVLVLSMDTFTLVPWMVSYVTCVKCMSNKYQTKLSRQLHWVWLSNRCYQNFIKYYKLDNSEAWENIHLISNGSIKTDHDTQW
jgi:hypothetical protein